MVGHNYPSKNFQTLVLLAVAQAVQKNVYIIFSGKNINPLVNRAGDKVLTLLIIDSVAVSHQLKITQRRALQMPFICRHAFNMSNCITLYCGRDRSGTPQ
jgi:hypothetical protein